MTTLQKIQKRGYDVTANLGHRNGEQTIISYTAKYTNGGSVTAVTRPNITQLYKSLHNRLK